MSVASAFYKGDKNRPMLQRIYGTCFPNRTQLDEHLERLEEARRRVLRMADETAEFRF